MESGIIENLSFAEYVQAPALNFSTLKLVDECPELVLYARENQEEIDSDALKFGRAYHTYILEPSLFEKSYFVTPKITRRGPEWLAVQAEAGTREILWTEDVQALKAMKSKLAKHSLFPGLISGSRREVSIFWQQNGIACKGRVDILNDSTLLLGDLKTTRSCKPETFVRDMIDRHYHQQMAWYATGLKSLGLDIASVAIVAQNKTPPYGLCIFEVTKELLNFGNFQNKRLFDEYQICIETKTWPSYPEKIYPVFAPQWLKDKLNGEMK